MPYCRIDKYCLDTSREHWEQFRHTERKNRKIIRVFHGTPASNAGSINSKGLRPSESGGLGPGFYFASRQVAENVSQCTDYHNQPYNGVYVIEVELDVGRMKTTLEEKGDQDGRWFTHENYDTCKALHPEWCRNDEFFEWCVRDPNRFRILRSYQKDATTHFDQAPQCPLVLHGRNKTTVNHGKTKLTYESDHDDSEAEISSTPPNNSRKKIEARRRR